MHNQVTFTSHIRPVNTKLFDMRALYLSPKSYVKDPWTVKETVFAHSAYTKYIEDCTVCGITDGENVFLMHICPTNFRNENFDKIVNFIKSRIDITQNELQGLLLGSKDKPYNEKSRILFEKFEKFLTKANIPTSKFKGGPIHSHTNVLYDSTKDEWLISGNHLDEFINTDSPGIVLKKVFDDVYISAEDVVTN